MGPSPILSDFANHTYVYLETVGAERAEKIAMVELRDVEPIEERLCARQLPRMTVRKVTAMNPPQRRPAIRAVAFDEVGEAIARLIVVAGCDTGHFPILHLCNCDATIAEDMLIVMAYLAQEPTVYPDAWGYRDAVVALVEQWRPA